MNKDKNHHLPLFDLLLVFVVCVSVSSVILLTFHKFDPKISFILGLILSVLFLRLFRLAIIRIDGRFGIGIWLILLLALLFRAEPYKYVMGGWDAGLYAIMSSYYGEEGSTCITDHVRNRLDDEQRESYDFYNHFQVWRETSPELVQKYEGKHYPGVYITDLDKSSYVFQFYPLHPIWMALFAEFFGDANRYYSLVLFSLISIIGFYFLALEISEGDRFAACLISFLLAINPAHAFFSKYPVAEIVTLAFSSTGLYFLLRYYKDSLKGAGALHHLFLSAGLMFCLFFTKINGFMYVPFFYFLLLASILLQPGGALRSSLISLFSVVFALYGVSVLYGLKFTYPYAFDIYEYSFPKLFGYDWQKYMPLFLISLMLLVYSLASARAEKHDDAFKKTGLLVGRSLPYVLYGVILAGVYRAYLLAFTDKYAAFFERFSWLTHAGWKSIKHSNIVVTISYMSPFAFILFLCAIYHYRKKKDIVFSGLFAFLVAFWTYGTVIRYFTPRQYEWVRYLLSELLPYSLLFVSLYVGILYRENRIPKVVIYSFVALMSVYPLYFTCSHFYSETGARPGINSSLERIAEHLDDEDLLLFCARNYGDPDAEPPLTIELRTPLSYYYHLNIFDVGHESNLSSRPVRDIVFSLSYKDVFVLSTRRIGQRFLIPVDELVYEFGKSSDSETFPPTAFTYDRRDLFLYKVDKTRLLRMAASAQKVLYIEHLKDNLVNFHPGSCWTKGDSLVTNIGYRLKPDDMFLVLHTAGWTPLKDEELDLRLCANDEELEFDHQDNNSFYFNLPQMKELTSIRITSSTFVPYELGMNDDTRRLGVCVQSISIE